MDINSFWGQFCPDSIVSDNDDDSDIDLVMQLMMEESSGDEDTTCKRKRPRSYDKDSRCTLYDKHLHEDFWVSHQVYTADDFKARFRLPIGLFDQIVEKVQQYDSYFSQKLVACKKLGIRSARR